MTRPNVQHISRIWTQSANRSPCQYRARLSFSNHRGSNSPSLSMFRTFLRLPSKNCEIKMSRLKLESHPDEVSVNKSRSLCVMSGCLRPRVPGLTSLYNWYVLTVMTPGVRGMTRVLDSDWDIRQLYAQTPANTTHSTVSSLNTELGSRRIFTFDNFNKTWPQPIIVYEAWDCFDDKLFIENSKDKRYHVSYLISNISWLYISIEKVYNPLLQAMKRILKVDDSFKFPVRQTLTNGQAWKGAAGGHFDHFTSD